MLGRRAKAGALVAALLILAVEGVLLVRYYSGIAPSSAQTSEGTMPEGTVLEEPTAALAGASIKATEATETTAPNERADDEEASFVHRATGANSRGDYTYLDHPSINADPDAVVLVVPASSGRDGGSSAYGHNIGVWYEPGERKWAVFNQDLAAVPAGSAFEVVVPRADEGFVHRAAPPNTVGNATYIDDPLTNGEPGAEVTVTQNWNPGGGNGVYNDHPVGVRFDEDEGEWFVHNEDDARMPEGAAFNVAASGAVQPAR